jgi:gliding motility-associated-like protein
LAGQRKVRYEKINYRRRADFIKGLVSQSKLLIFNRYGKRLYETDNYTNNWDGKDEEGKILESNTYWYILIVPGIAGELKGFVYLKK